MKILIAVMLISNYLFGSTIQEITPDYHFDEHVHVDKSVNSKLDVKLEKNYFNLKLNSNQKKRQFKKYQEALNLLEQVVNSSQFKARVISYKRQVGTNENGEAVWENTYAKNYLWNEEGKRLSNEDVYNTIMHGDEKMRPNTQGSMNINSRVKRSWSRKVIGYTNPSKSEFMTLNWHFYKKLETHEMVSNMVHEWIHLLGFLHGPRETMKQEVPYIVGYIAGEIAKEILEGKSIQ